MGSGSSKAAAKSGDDRRTRFKAARVLNSSCFGFSSSMLSDDQKEEESGRSKGKKCTDEGERISNGEEEEEEDDGEAYRRESGKTPSVTTTPKLELSQEDQERPFQFDSGSGSSSLTRAAIGRSSNPSTRLPCRFGFNNEGIAFRLSRTLSLGSSRDRARISTTQNTTGGCGNDIVGDPSGDGGGGRENFAEETVSSRNEVGCDVNIQSDVSEPSRGIHVEGENSETRHSVRWMTPQEPLEGSVRFSRTRSVGRLRDRVLRGNPVPEGLFHPGMLEEVSIGHLRQPNGRQVLAGSRRAPSFSDTSNESLPASSNNRVNLRSNSMDRRHDRAYEAAQRREASSHDLLEHRSAFLERRRRIRSQVRALERLGRRFANLSGHDRSCILSGQHRTGRCICRTNSRSANPDDDMSARASISRIVMLAEALFEVLDEIHQQSAVLSSRPSFSSVGSVPAPKEIVESMPTKVHMKPQRHKNEENEQCYICLVEYEEGDCMRVLPCNHEFHQTCIDKWLKEIHRVCPLCRGDVCRGNTSNME